MGATTASPSTVLRRRTGWRSLLAVLATSTVIVSLAGPAYAAPAPAPTPVNVHVEGTLTVVEPEAAAGQVNPDPGADAAGYHVITADGTAVPVAGSLIPADAASGDTVNITAAPTAAVIQEAGTKATGTVTADSVAGQQLIEAAAAADAPLNVTAGTVTAATPVAGTVAVNHTIDVAVVTDPNGKVAATTDAFINGMISRVSDFWAEQSAGSVPQITVNQIIRYTAATNTCSPNQHTLWNEASVKFGKSNYGAYVTSAGSHLLVIANADCGLDSGLGTVGGGMNGGVTWAALGGGYADDLTVAHEIGHNFSLNHSNVENCSGTAFDGARVLSGSTYKYSNGCTEKEYADLYDVMGQGYLMCNPTCHGNTNIPALNINSKSKLGLVTNSDLTAVQLAGASLDTNYTINAASATSGVRGLNITDPISGEHYFIEYRNALGRDAGSVYEMLLNGTSQFDKMGPGVRVLKDGLNQAGSVVIPDGTSTARKLSWLTGRTFTSRTTGVTMTVTATSSTAATVNVKLRQQPSFSGENLPTITGNLWVGQTLTAAAGTGWTPTPGAYTYQWFRNGVAVTGKTAKTYVLSADDTGKTLTVQVNATKVNYRDRSYTSAATGTVSATPVFAGANLPTFTGATVVGQTLTAVPGAGWTPVATSYEYQWTRDGANITGSTAKTYLTVAADIGHNIAVKITSIKVGYTTRSLTSAQKVIADLPVFTGDNPALINGVRQNGQTLTAAPGGGWAPAPTSYQYQWKRDGVAIAGATAATFKQTATDVGHALTVTMTGAKTGTKPRTWTSAAGVPTVDTNVFAGQTAPTITGDRKVTKTLTGAAPKGWLPVPTVYQYQWKRDGVAIAGATAKTYIQQPADIGHILTLTVTATKVGVATRTATTDPAAPTADYSLFTGDAAPTLSVNPKTALAVAAVNGAGWAPTTGVTYTYQWAVDGVAVTTAKAKTYTPVVTDLGKALTVTVTANSGGFLPKARTSGPVTVTQQVFTGATAAKITGTVQVGGILTAAIDGAVTPAPTYTYQWAADGQPITGATAKTYTLKAAELSKKITVTLTGTKAGTVTKTWVSPASVAVAAMPKFSGTPSPLITGTPKVGVTLAAVPNTGWVPTPTSYTYRWLRDGTTIAGATAKTYKLAAADVGKYVTLEITGIKAGYQPKVAVTAAIMKVAAA